MTSKHKIDPPALVEDTGDVIHPGSMIRDQLAEAGYSVNAAAAAMALNRANLNNVVLGKVAVSRDLRISSVGAVEPRRCRHGLCPPAGRLAGPL